MDVERLRSLIAIQRAVVAASDDGVQSILEAIVAETQVMPQANGIVVEMVEAAALVYRAASGTSAQMLGLRLPLENSLSGLAIRTGEPLTCVDSEVDPRVNREACRRVGLRSMIVVPIPHGGRSVGVLKFHAAEPNAFDDDDLLVAHLLVGSIALGLGRAVVDWAAETALELKRVIELKEELISTVSHELRSPIAAISGSLGLLAGDTTGGLSDRAAGLVAMAARNTERLARMVNDLLDLDRFDRGGFTLNIADSDWRALLRDVVDLNEPLAASLGVQLKLSLPQARLWAPTDPDRLQQAITNLVVNAIKYSPPEGVVRVSLACEGPAATVRVVDQGPGVPQAFRMRMFERFSRAGDVPRATNLKGSGLGLAIAKSIVERLGGTIRLDEQVTDGSAFEIRLPIEAERQAAAG